MTTTTITRPNILSRVGVDVSQAKTGAEALSMAKLNWNVSARDLFHSGTEVGIVKEIPTHRAFVRDDSEAVLSVLTKDFTPVQNEKVLSFFDPFLSSGEATLEFAGELKGGKAIWACAKLNRAPIVVKGNDTVNKYLLAVNSHDGTRALRIQLLPFRPACSNILQRLGKIGEFIRILHTAKAEATLDEVQKIVNASNAAFEATAKQYQKLAGKSVKEKDLKKFVKLVFAPHNVDEQRQELALEKHEETIKRLFETGAGSDLESAKGTYWGLYNAVTEYLTHERGRNESSRMASLVLGSEARLGAKALEAALVMAR